MKLAETIPKPPNLVGKVTSECNLIIIIIIICDFVSGVAQVTKLSKLSAASCSQASSRILKDFEVARCLENLVGDRR